MSAKIYGYQNFGKANFGTKPIMPMFPLLLGQWPPKGLEVEKTTRQPSYSQSATEDPPSQSA